LAIPTQRRRGRLPTEKLIVLEDGAGLISSACVALAAGRPFLGRSYSWFAHFQIGNKPDYFSNVISGGWRLLLDNYGGNPPLVFAAATPTGHHDIRFRHGALMIGKRFICSGSTNVSWRERHFGLRAAGPITRWRWQTGQTLQGSGHRSTAT